MNTKAFGLIFCTLVAMASTLVAAKPPAEVFKDDKEKLGYAIGVNLATSLKGQNVPVDITALVQAIQDVYTDGRDRMTALEAAKVIGDFQRELQAKEMVRWAAMGVSNKVEGAAFLATNKLQPGVVTLPSGLQYRVLQEGSGTPPKQEDLVDVYFHSRLIDGTQFDSSDHLRKPAVLAVNAVMPGWNEALKLMKPGSKWELVVPPELAYADHGRAPTVGPAATLVCDIELLSVRPPPAPVPPMTSDIIRVPSSEELQKGVQPKTLKPEEVEKLRKQYETHEAAQKKLKASGTNK